MTHLPVEAERCETTEDAATIMHQNDVHHVPVMSGSHFKGMVSHTELLEARIRLKEKWSTTPLDHLCSSNPLIVAPVDPIDEVVRQMLQHSTDAAVVMDGGFVVGIFSTTDALRFISDLFGQQ